MTLGAQSRLERRWFNLCKTEEPAPTATGSPERRAPQTDFVFSVVFFTASLLGSVLEVEAEHQGKGA